jgi:hypothetical protein
MKDIEGSLVMWRKEDMKLVWIHNIFGMKIYGTCYTCLTTILKLDCVPILDLGNIDVLKLEIEWQLVL